MLKNKNKWSIKYDKCKICGTTEKRHQSKGVCANCYEKKRARILKKDPKIKEDIKQKKHLWYLKNKGKEDYKEKEKIRARKFYKENTFIIKIKRLVKIRKQKNLPCMEMYIDDKKFILPFESLEKPQFFKTKEHDKWKKNNEIFKTLINLVNNKNKNE